MLDADYNCSEKLENVGSVRYLGITIGQHLRWNFQVDAMQASLRKTHLHIHQL